MKKANLEVKVGKLTLKNPVMAASGTFGYGAEFEGVADIKKLGAIVTKTITPRARVGNKPPRVIETASGMLNAIGLENPGMDAFIADKLPALKKFNVPVIASIAGETQAEYGELARKLDGIKEIAALEVNISCPNVETSALFAQSAQATADVVKAVREATRKTIIAKLSPNVTDIVSIAKAAEAAGSDALSLVNTITGMAVDSEKRTSRLGTITGGLSGPAIKPIALLMVWKAYHSVKIPIVGMGGIISWQDAVEFVLCGATAVGVGTANFVNPNATADVVDGLARYVKEHKIKDVNNLIGSLRI